MELYYDLRKHESIRNDLVLRSGWTVDVTEEMQAEVLLYSNLSPEQEEVYDELVTAGVLPERAL